MEVSDLLGRERGELTDLKPSEDKVGPPGDGLGQLRGSGTTVLCLPEVRNRAFLHPLRSAGVCSSSFLLSGLATVWPPPERDRGSERTSDISHSPSLSALYGTGLWGKHVGTSLISSLSHWS